MRTIIFFCTIFLSSAACAGQDWNFSAPHIQRCSDGAQQQMNTCMADEYAKVDARLNAAYKKLINLLEDVSKLKNAQIAWLRFRDSSCDYENSGIGRDGSLYPFVQYACRIDFSEKRIRDLQRYLAWDGNDSPPRKSP